MSEQPRRWTMEQRERIAEMRKGRKGPRWEECEDGCWRWLLSKTPTDGYPQVRIEGKLTRAHRWMWMEMFGPIPGGLCVHHKCGTRSCVRPDHLALVELSEHLGQHHSRLSADDIREVRRRYVRGHRYRPGNRDALAHEFGVSPQHMKAILKGRWYRWVT